METHPRLLWSFIISRVKGRRSSLQPHETVTASLCLVTFLLYVTSFRGDLGYQKGVRPYEIFRHVPMPILFRSTSVLLVMLRFAERTRPSGVYLTAAGNKYWRTVGVSSDDGLALGPCKSFFVDACILLCQALEVSIIAGQGTQ